MRNSIAVLFAGLLCGSGNSARAQACPDTVVSLVTVRVQKLISQAAARQRVGMRQPVTSETPLQIDIDLNAKVKTAPKPADFTITLLPGGTAVDGNSAVSTVAPIEGEPRRVSVALKPLPGFDPEHHTDLRIAIRGLALECGTVDVDTTKTIIMTPEQFQAEFQRVAAAAEAVGTAADERNIYAGFAAVKGEAGNSEGAADIVINQRFFRAERRVGALFDSADIKLLVKKSSGANADPRSYSTGVEMTKALLWKGARQARIESSRLADEQKLHPMTPGTRVLADAAGIDQARRLAAGSDWFRGVVINEFLKMEGDAFDFKTVNFVSDTQFTLPSVAKPLGHCAAPCVAPGFFRFRVLGGPELGRNMRDPADPATAAGADLAPGSKAVDYIFRSKAGADMTLRYGRSESRPSDFAVELDLAYVNRWIHRPEPVIQDILRDGQTVQERVTIQKGTRPWRQADLKLFLFGNEKMRYGIKFSFYSGSLPPSFAKTRALQVGIVIQSNDEKTDGAPVSK